MGLGPIIMLNVRTLVSVRVNKDLWLDFKLTHSIRGLGEFSTLAVYNYVILKNDVASLSIRAIAGTRTKMTSWQHSV